MPSHQPFDPATAGPRPRVRRAAWTRELPLAALAMDLPDLGIGVACVVGRHAADAGSCRNLSIQRRSTAQTELLGDRSDRSTTRYRQFNGLAFVVLCEPSKLTFWHSIPPGSLSYYRCPLIRRRCRSPISRASERRRCISRSEQPSWILRWCMIACCAITLAFEVICPCNFLAAETISGGLLNSPVASE